MEPLFAPALYRFGDCVSHILVAAASGQVEWLFQLWGFCASLYREARCVCRKPPVHETVSMVVIPHNNGTLKAQNVRR